MINPDVTQKPEESIYDRIGFRRSLYAVFKATPWRSMSCLPSHFLSYRQFFKESSTLNDLLEEHGREYTYTTKNLLKNRPRYSKLRKYLWEKGIR